MPLGILVHWVQVMRSTGTLGRRWLMGDKGFVDRRMCLLSETLALIPGCNCPVLFFFFFLHLWVYNLYTYNALKPL
uniref:Uncharacterized protein n=1 Tax=Ixodes scapularis TaxID=6945 RepID=A0A4D5RYI6_IXOSC